VEVDDVDWVDEMDCGDLGGVVRHSLALGCIFLREL
jgi:hypothetical protein